MFLVPGMLCSPARMGCSFYRSEVGPEEQSNRWNKGKDQHLAESGMGGVVAQLAAHKMPIRTVTASPIPILNQIGIYILLHYFSISHLQNGGNE